MLAYQAGGGAGAAGGVGVLAVPLLVNDLSGTGVATELAIQNLVPFAGDTDVAVLVYDENDLVQVLCRRIGAGRTEYIDLWQEAAPVLHGFMGSAVISATSWHHPDPATGANRLGLGAVAVQRIGTTRGEDVPGDELTISPGIPLRRAPADALAIGGECPAPPAPAPPAPDAGLNAADGVVFLPVMANQGQDSVCQLDVTVINDSGAPARMVAVMYAEPGFAAPDCSGPAQVMCSGLIAPAGTWVFGQDLGETFSGVVYGFNTNTLADLGVPGGGDETVADWLCRAGGLTDDCDASRQLHLAYALGGRYKGVPLAGAFAAPIRASVQRECPDTSIPGESDTSTYSGIGGGPFDLTRPGAGGHWNSMATVMADMAGLNTVLYLQNAGVSTTSVAITYRPLGELSGGTQCSVFNLAPGEAYPFDTADCVGPDFEGTAFIHSTEHLALVGETLGTRIQRTWAGYPTWSAYDLDNDADVDDDDLAVFLRALGSTPRAANLAELLRALDSTPQTANWNPRADYDHDLAVNWSDREIFEAGGLGRVATAPTPSATEPAPATPEPSPTAKATAPGEPTTDPRRFHVYLPFAFHRQR